MHIGLLCEGPSDVPAITHFFGDQLRKRGIEPSFRNLFPEPDRTRSGGGWSNLLLWLKSNPAETRIARYFSAGLFGGDDAQPPLDALVIHIDADVVEEVGFRNYIASEFGLICNLVEAPAQRGELIAQVLRSACDFDSMTEIDRSRHVAAVAVEATEAWCLAVFHPQPRAFEELRGQALTDAFMQALERSESRAPQPEYVNCDKDVVRRSRFCANFAAHSDRIVASCPHFAAAVGAVSALAP